MKVAVVGVNSFLGSAIVRNELNNGNTVVGVYHINKNLLNNAIDNIYIDEFLIASDYFDVIYILSAYIPQQDINHPLLFDVNVKLVEKICNQNKESKIVLASSVSVYEGNNNNVLTENSYTSPQSAYAISKLWAEKIVSNHKNYAIVRISSMYGVGMKCNTFLPKIILNALQNNNISILGNGSRKQNYVSVNEVALTMCLAAKNKINEIFLATSTLSYTNLDVAKMIQKINPKVKIDFKGEDFSKSYYYNDEKTRDVLNKENSILLEDEILALYEWIKKF